MSGFDENSDRRVLPLWRSASGAARSFEMKPLVESKKSRAPEVMDDLSIRQEDFRLLPSLGTAADAINSAILSQKQDLIPDVIDYVLKNQANAPKPLVRLALNIKNPGTNEDISNDLPSQRKLKIAELRHLLKIEPRNPVLLVDLAREYSSIGKLEAADKSIRTALDLARGNRWVSRMAARFLVHAGRKSEAYSLISTHPLIQGDPWMLSAEIAIAQVSGRDPKHWTRAKNLLQGSLAARHLSELACAVGTLELANGNSKKARRNFRQALIDPTDNALAQLKWAERNLKADLATDVQLGERESAYEARLWAAYYRADIPTAKKYAERWLNEEPFSKRPAIMLSYILSLLDDSARAIQIAQWGMQANPDDATLKLNYLFSYLSSNWKNHSDEQNTADKIEKELVSVINSESSFATHARANLGLLYYRQGKFEEARKQYDYAEKIQNSDEKRLSAASAIVFHAREALIHKVPWATTVLEDARMVMKTVQSPGLKYYLAKVEYATKHPDLIETIFSVGFEVPSLLIEDDRKAPLEFELGPNGATIWLPSKKSK